MSERVSRNFMGYKVTQIVTPRTTPIFKLLNIRKYQKVHALI